MNIVLRSEITTSDDKGKHPEEGGSVHKTPKKEVGFDLEHAKEMFMEAKKSFAEASTSGIQDKISEEIDPSMLITFFETCMKLLRDRKSMKGLQELINKCASKENIPEGPCVVKKIGKRKARIGRVMRLTAQT